jgi:hypothetical protein
MCSEAQPKGRDQVKEVAAQPLNECGTPWETAKTALGMMAQRKTAC